jgi:hypothetical protein
MNKDDMPALAKLIVCDVKVEIFKIMRTLLKSFTPILKLLEDIWRDIQSWNELLQTFYEDLKEFLKHFKGSPKISGRLLVVLHGRRACSVLY